MTQGHYVAQIPCTAGAPPPRAAFGANGGERPAVVLEVGQVLERRHAGIDLVAFEAADPLGAEVLDVEGGHRRAADHRLAELAVARGVVAEAVEEAEEASREGVAGAGRVADLGDR